MMIEIDRAEVLECAKLVRKLNKHAASYPVAALAENMIRTAQRELSDGPGYVSTLGYVLITFAYPERPGILGLKCAISVHCADPANHSR